MRSAKHNKKQRKVNWDKAQQRAAITAKWAVIMTKVRIRGVVSRTRWQLITFCGKKGGESRGVVDLLAVRKDHRTIMKGTNRGDLLEAIIIQVKGGGAAMPTIEDATRLLAVKRWHRAKHVLLASWRRGKAVKFFSLSKRSSGISWKEVEQIEEVFR